MPKKSKPKPRTNWKQRALHCEEVIGVQNQVAAARESKLGQLLNDRAFYSDLLTKTQLARDGYKTRAESAILRAQKAESALDESGKQVNALRFRAESAEKHNALLLEERNRTTTAIDRLESEMALTDECIDKLTGARPPANQLFPAIRTHWQRFKSSWRAGFRQGRKDGARMSFKSLLAKYYVELLCILVILGVAGAFAAFVWKQGG